MRIQTIERHVEQITVLQQTVAQIQIKVCSVFTEMASIKSKHIEYESSIQAYSNMCAEVLKSQVSKNERLNGLKSKIENLNLEHSNLREEFLDSKTHQICENLIYWH